GFAPLTNDKLGTFVGVAIKLNGFLLEFIFDTDEMPPLPWTNRIRKPSELVFIKNRRQHHVLLTWPIGNPEASIRIEQARYNKQAK
ncbi:MAG: hypothetical protein SFW65_02030, partial [Alphaproteobacteria bacterium]|nr:hypothetical protein [Alphaproteobacteria bacterium]